MNALQLAFAVCLAYVLDWGLGEARRFHPLVGFGNLTQYIEKHCNHAQARRWEGVLAWILVVLPIVLFTQAGLLWLMEKNTWLAVGAHACLLYLCIGLRSLKEHNLPILQALQAGDVEAARQLTARIVSRDTAEASPDELAKASVESMLENGCDAVFGAVFWFILLGGAGAVLYRLSNTLDAMWGYKTPRFLHFGWMAARTDDALNYLPARMTALTYGVLGDARAAWRCWRAQAPAWASPNAGPVMAAGAGALGVCLGGQARYAGELEDRPVLGLGEAAQPADIRRAWNLVSRGMALWLLIITLAALVFWGIEHA